MGSKETTKPIKANRVKTGCLTCRNKRRKCDEIKSIDKESDKLKCQYCMLKNFECIWPATVFGPVFVNTSIEDGESIKRKKLSQPKPENISGGLSDFMNTTKQKIIENGILKVPAIKSDTNINIVSNQNHSHNGRTDSSKLNNGLTMNHSSRTTSKSISSSISNPNPVPITANNLQANNDLQNLKFNQPDAIPINNNLSNIRNETQGLKKTSSVLSLKNYNFNLIQSLSPGQGTGTGPGGTGPSIQKTAPITPYLSHLSPAASKFLPQQQRAGHSSELPPIPIQNPGNVDESPNSSYQPGPVSQYSMTHSYPHTHPNLNHHRHLHHQQHPATHQNQHQPPLPLQVGAPQYGQPFDQTPKFSDFGFDEIESPRFDSMKRDALDYNQFVDFLGDSEPNYYEIPDTLRDFMYLNAAASSLTDNNNDLINNQTSFSINGQNSTNPQQTLIPKRPSQHIDFKNESPISLPSDVPPADEFKQYFQSESFQNVEPPYIPETERILLMKNFVEEISHWLDMFNKERHFGTIIPAMALDCPELMYSILAISAKQYEATHSNYPKDRAIYLYQFALQQLVSTTTTPTPDKNGASNNNNHGDFSKISVSESGILPACVLLCLFAMMSSAPRTWRRNLEGCFVLFKTQGIHGFASPLQRSVFWSFIRMDVCSAVIGEQGTITGSRFWLPPNSSIYEAERLFKNELNNENWDMYANYMVFLVSRVMNLVSSTDPSVDFEKEWKLLWEEIKRWEINKPIGMKPIYENDDPTTFAFPKILYSNGAAVSGNQMYHMATILMIQNKPRLLKLNTLPNDEIDSRKMSLHVVDSPSASSPNSVKSTTPADTSNSKNNDTEHNNNNFGGSNNGNNNSSYQIHSKSLTWHARRICGIGFSNSDHGAYTNSLQPFWVAGKLTSSVTEHNLILKHLNSIEKECGFPTKNRCKDLIEYWNGNI